MTGHSERRRRFYALILGCALLMGAMFVNPDMWQQEVPAQSKSVVATSPAIEKLNELEVKGRAPKTDYDRSMFGGGWSSVEGCDTRNIILNRDLKDIAVGGDCQIQSGTLEDPYTGKTIVFNRGVGTSDDIQIDHVVALSDAWQKGAQSMSYEQRKAFANDPLELLAVDGPANQRKGGGDAATWLPSNKVFRCQYVARQIAVKLKYGLWVTSAEYEAMKRVLSVCPNQALPSASN